MGLLADIIIKSVWLSVKSEFQGKCDKKRRRYGRTEEKKTG